MAYLIVIVIAILLAYLIVDYIISAREDQIRERLTAGVLDGVEEEVSLWSDAADLLKVDEFRKLVEKSTITRNLDINLKRSGIKLTLLKAIGLIVTSGLLGALGGYFYFKDISAGVGGFFVLPVSMWMLLRFLSQRRLKKHDEQLPAFITSIITTMGAGGTPMQALQAVSRNSPNPIAESISSIVNAMQLGKSPNVAWKEWADFWGTKSCKLFSTGVRLKWETGGQMTTILHHILETLEFHKRMELRVSTLTAQAKLSAWVLSALPAGLALLTNAYRPDLFDAMLTDPLGIKLLTAAGVMSLLGFIWLRKIAQLKN
ncbi:MAG: type II secretion system F family protein [Methylotenera sp.]|nr:type II secretion system F family protein [Methylotenera sp.]